MTPLAVSKYCFAMPISMLLQFDLHCMLFIEADMERYRAALSHPHATATGGRTSTGSDHTICSGVEALDSHPAGLAAEVVNSKRSTQRSATRCVAT